MRCGEHVAGVATQAGPPGLSATIAYCSCGWRGPVAYRTRAEAQAAADEHERPRHGEDAIRFDERLQIIQALEASGRSEAARFIQAAFRDPEAA